MKREQKDEIKARWVLPSQRIEAFRAAGYTIFESKDPNLEEIFGDMVPSFVEGTFDIERIAPSKHGFAYAIKVAS